MSNINPLNINGAYPVAGVDNDSQGFRDNFTNIKNNFAYAQSELNDLQSKVIVKSQLTGTTLNNNMAGTLLSSALIQDFREVEYDNGVISTTVTLDHAQGHYQRVQTNAASINILFTGFPAAGAVGRIRLKLVVTNAAHRIVLPAAVSVGVAYIHEYSSVDNSIGFAACGTGTYWIEFWTDDNGATIQITDLTRARTNTDYIYYGTVANGSAGSPTWVNVSAQKTFIDSTAQQLNYINIGFPLNPVDGQSFMVANRPPMYVNLYANTTAATTIMGNVTSINANSTNNWTFVSTANKWYKSVL
jgi:hypothetical protein